MFFFLTTTSPQEHLARGASGASCHTKPEQVNESAKTKKCLNLTTGACSAHSRGKQNQKKLRDTRQRCGGARREGPPTLPVRRTLRNFRVQASADPGSSGAPVGDCQSACPDAHRAARATLSEAQGQCPGRRSIVHSLMTGSVRTVSDGGESERPATTTEIERLFHSPF